MYFLWLTFPNELIYLVVNDVAGAFKNYILHSDFIGAFGYLSTLGSFFIIIMLHMNFSKIEAPSESMLFADLRAALAEFLLTPLGRLFLPPFWLVLSRTLPYRPPSAL